MKLILASSSPFRKQLLTQLQLNFECDSPDIDETPHERESVEEMVLRLSIEKAHAVAAKHKDVLVIGSDQSALLNGSILTKPGNHENAVKQLQQASGQQVVFQTGLCLFNAATGDYQSILVPYTVKFRQLTDMQIEHYLQKERPYNCAGSFKSEGLGIALFENMSGSDPSALIGLPLIELTSMLEKAGMPVI